MTSIDELPCDWWVFELPYGTLAHVPAPTEAGARQRLRATCFVGAPVDAWPCVASRFMSREALLRSLGGLASPFVGNDKTSTGGESHKPVETGASEGKPRQDAPVRAHNPRASEGAGFVVVTTPDDDVVPLADRGPVSASFGTHPLGGAAAPMIDPSVTSWTGETRANPFVEAMVPPVPDLEPGLLSAAEHCEREAGAYDDQDRDEVRVLLMMARRLRRTASSQTVPTGSPDIAIVVDESGGKTA